MKDMFVELSNESLIDRLISEIVDDCEFDNWPNVKKVQGEILRRLSNSREPDAVGVSKGETAKDWEEALDNLYRECEGLDADTLNHLGSVAGLLAMVSPEDRKRRIAVLVRVAALAWKSLNDLETALDSLDGGW